MVPEGFLNDAQKQAKQDALARESGKIRKLSFSLKDASPTDISALEDVSGKPTWIPAVHAIDAITLHMLRHPYVKPTTKKFASFLKFFRAAVIAARSCSIRYSWLIPPSQISPILKSLA